MIPVHCSVCNKLIVEYKKMNIRYCDECKPVVQRMQSKMSSKRKRFGVV
jgi:hypothetical protein